MNVFFKKPNPKAKLFLSRSGGYVQFTTVDHDTGIFILSDAGHTGQKMVSDLRDLAKEGFCEEIDEAQFRELDAKKNNLPSSPVRGREEISKATMTASSTVKLHERTRPLPAADVAAPVADKPRTPVVPPTPPRPNVRRVE